MVCGPLPARWLRSTLKIVARTRLAAHRVTGGSVGGHWNGADLVMTTTIPRRSGRRHTTPLVFLPYATDIAVVASNGGSERGPHWWCNLQRDPHADLEIAGTHKPVAARPADADEQWVVSAWFCAALPRFERYRRRVHRDVPVVVLEPVT